MSKVCQSRELEALLQRKGLLVQGCSENVEFTGICNNSKEAKSGDLFVCKGMAFKPEYLKMAADRGAVIYMAEQNPIDIVDLPCILVSDVRKAQSVLARWFYDEPSNSFRLVGVTGTKGKTTTTHMAHAVMNAVCGRETGLISGVTCSVGSEVEAPHISTPESLELQYFYSLARQNGLPAVTSEISSQAYNVDRVYDQPFNYGIFLNIAPDHISDYEHPTMENYLWCKINLLENSEVGVICRDTDYYDTVYNAAKAKCRRVCLVGETEDCDYRFHSVEKRKPAGYTFLVTEKDTGETHPYAILMDGVFNIKNAVAAIAVGRMEGGDPAAIADALRDLTVEGRGDVYVGGGVTVIVNYMHNGISCQAVLEALEKDYPDTHKVVMIGIGYRRSPTRVDDIARICSKYADHCYFTVEDPDTDDPVDIVNRLEKAAVGGKAKITKEPDRGRAAERAVWEAPDGAIIILAGKGGETTHKINGVQEPYESDPGIAKRVIAMREAAKAKQK